MLGLSSSDIDGEKKKIPRSREESSALQAPLIADSIVECIGRTPLVRLGRIAKEHGVVANILLKVEFMNPCSSVKDRIARTVVEEAEKRGEISPGQSILLDCTSGNTGIGLAMVGAAKGYQVMIVMPEYASLERRMTMKALGATLVLLRPTMASQDLSIRQIKLLRRSESRCIMSGSLVTPIIQELTGRREHVPSSYYNCS